MQKKFYRLLPGHITPIQTWDEEPAEYLYYDGTFKRFTGRSGPCSSSMFKKLHIYEVGVNGTESFELDGQDVTLDPILHKVGAVTCAVIGYTFDSKGFVTSIGGMAATYKVTMVTVDSVKTSQVGTLNGAFSTASSVLRVGYPEDEVASWDKQEAEARAWAEDSLAPTPFLSKIASERNLTMVKLADKVIVKANAAMAYLGPLVGARQAKEDSIELIVADEAMSDKDKIIAIRMVF